VTRRGGGSKRENIKKGENWIRWEGGEASSDPLRVLYSWQALRRWRWRWCLVYIRSFVGAISLSMRGEEQKNLPPPSPPPPSPPSPFPFKEGEGGGGGERGGYSTQVRHHTRLALCTCCVLFAKNLMMTCEYFPRIWYGGPTHWMLLSLYLTSIYYVTMMSPPRRFPMVQISLLYMCGLGLCRVLCIRFWLPWPSWPKSLWLAVG